MYEENFSTYDLEDLISRIESLEKVLSGKIGDVQSKHEHNEQQDPHMLRDLDLEKPSMVKLTTQAYLKIAIHAKKYSNDNIDPAKWVEVIGLLSGQIMNENTPLEYIEVDDAWPIGHGDAVSVSILNTTAFTDLVAKLPSNHYIIGWYHSHPSYDTFLSIDDYNTQRRYQALWNKSIALVIDPTRVSTRDFGYAVFRNIEDKSLKPGYTELSSEVMGIEPQATAQIIKLMEPLFKQNNISVDQFLDHHDQTNKKNKPKGL